MAQVAEIVVRCKPSCVQDARRLAARKPEQILSAVRRLRIAEERISRAMGEIESELKPPAGRN
jgi:hypothetical protein